MSEKGNLAVLEAAYANIDPYQPLYGVGGHANVLRPTTDRCETIYSYFQQNVQDVRFLDVGCNAGYVSFYLADRGGKVTAWDYDPDNIEVCDDLKAVNKLPVDFSLQSFGLEAIKGIEADQFDTATILNVLHWTIHEQGLEYVQGCMKELLAKVPMVIVELAQKDEGNDVPYYETAPENDLVVFDTVEGVKIEKIGEFETHQHTKLRPMYVVTAGKPSHTA